MKKMLLLGIACGLATAALAENVAPIILPEFYTMNISPDGRWIGSNDGNEYTMIYDRVGGGEPVMYSEAMLGNGNAIALNGMAVGATASDRPVLMYEEEVLFPAVFDNYSFAGLHGITADGKRVCGIVSNPKSGGSTDEVNQMYLPIYAEVVDGEVGEPVVLPTPEKDFFGTVPQYCSAVWISNDGKTILGQVVANSGMFIAPIVYKQNEAGEWSYTLPTEPLFNTENLPLPVYPGEFDLVPPNYVDYMTEENAAAYQAAIDEFIASGYTSPYPNAEDYMTEEAIEEYNKAADVYNEAAMKYNEALAKYLEEFYAVMDCSVNIVQNGQTMSSDGMTVACAAEFTEESEGFMPIKYYVTYVFNLEDGTYREIKSDVKNIIPGQICANGIVIGNAVPSFDDVVPPLSYVLTADAKDYVALEEYLEGVNPESAKWMKENLNAELIVAYDEETFEPMYEDFVMTGHAMASDDMTVISGGVMAYLMEDEDRYPYSFMSYVIDGTNVTGVDGVAADNGAVKALRNGLLLVKGNVESIKVYDLSGRQVFAASNASGIVDTKLGNGLYVVTYVDAEGQNVASKVRF